MRERTYELKHKADHPPCAADLPMSVLNCCLIFVEDNTDKTVRHALRMQPAGLWYSRLRSAFAPR